MCTRLEQPNTDAHGSGFFGRTGPRPPSQMTSLVSAPHPPPPAGAPIRAAAALPSEVGEANKINKPNNCLGKNGLIVLQDFSKYPPKRRRPPVKGAGALRRWRWHVRIVSGAWALLVSPWRYEIVSAGGVVGREAPQSPARVGEVNWRLPRGRWRDHRSAARRFGADCTRPSAVATEPRQLPSHSISRQVRSLGIDTVSRPSSRNSWSEGARVHENSRLKFVSAHPRGAAQECAGIRNLADRAVT